MTAQIQCPICNAESHYVFSSRDIMFNHFKRYDYHRCTDCELEFLVPLPAPETIAGFYPDDYDVYEESRRLKRISAFRRAKLKKYHGYHHLSSSWLYNALASIAHLLKIGEREIDFLPNGLLLDIGCGNGRFLHGMKQLGWQVKGVEFNAHAVNTCRKSDLDVFHGDLLSANFNDDLFDVINLSHVIEHVPNPKELFAEMARILKPNGILLLKTPNSQALGRAILGSNWFANDAPRHLYLFSEKNLTVLGETYHLEVSDIKTSSTAKVILNSLDHVLKNQGTPSKRIGWRRLLAKPFVWLEQYLDRGDEVEVLFKKR